MGTHTRMRNFQTHKPCENNTNIIHYYRNVNIMHIKAIYQAFLVLANCP